MNDFAGKVVLVTGGSRGIGRACVMEFARRGAIVALTYYPGNEAEAEEVVKLVGAQASAWSLDVVDTKACTQLVEEVVKKHGRLDVLVNNAGIAIDGLVMRFRDEDWDAVLSTNLRGAFALCRAVTRPMLRQRSGAIVNLASVVGEMGNAGQTAYAASKAGLIGLSKSLARELASRSIRVNAVAPGFIDTEMTARLPAEVKEKMVASIALGRLGKAEDIARAVVFLASEEASYITGEVLKVNGGMYM
ncbi:MAG: 3-oxoacyl-[acyl-carrier-protein] reductase [Cystobacterineae bacterium]|nr:3-oxoacyl-[acyl-carrier-protein] reductase [Cystobacterineae bacterium]